MSGDARKKKKSKKKSGDGLPIGLILGIGIGIVVLGGVATVGGMLVFRSMKGNSPVANATPAGIVPNGNPIPPAAPGAVKPAEPAASSKAVHTPVMTPDALPLAPTAISWKGRFQIRIPAEWIQGPEEAWFQVRIKKDGDPDQIRAGGIVVQVFPQKGQTLQDVSDPIIATIKRSKGTILEDGPALISGLTARRVFSEQVIDANSAKRNGWPEGETSRTLEYFVGPVDGSIHWIKFFANNDQGRFDKLMPTYEAIASTYRAPPQ